jgi:hypothetical protein
LVTNASLLESPLIPFRPGAVFEFTRTGATWAQQSQFTGSDSEQGTSSPGRWPLRAHRGHRRPQQANLPGASYVFTQTATDLHQQAILRAPHPLGGETFGRTVALSGTTALIGAPRVGGAIGTAYVLVHTATAWARQPTLTAALAGAPDHNNFHGQVDLFTL